MTQLSTPWGKVSNPRPGRPKAETFGEGFASKPLSARQIQAIDLLAQGLVRKQIAHEMGISISCAHAHLTNAMLRLKARNRAHAIVLWLNREDPADVETQALRASHRAPNSPPPTDPDPAAPLWSRHYTWFRLEQSGG